MTDRQQIESVVVKVMVAVLKCEVNLESSRQSVPIWDSLKHIEVIFALEDELGIQFSEEELSAMGSVSQIVEGVLSRHAS